MTISISNFLPGDLVWWERKLAKGGAIKRVPGKVFYNNKKGVVVKITDPLGQTVLKTLHKDELKKRD